MLIHFVVLIQVPSLVIVFRTVAAHIFELAILLEPVLEHAIRVLTSDDLKLGLRALFLFVATSGFLILTIRVSEAV